MRARKRRAWRCERGDFVIVRTGQMEHCLARGDWGTYAAGDAPGLRFETAEWIHRKQIAAICLDTWGCEVRPNESTEAFQPWHWIVIPMIGICMGEIFYLKDLADDCAQGQGVRVPVLRAGVADHRRGRLADQSDRAEVKPDSRMAIAPILGFPRCRRGRNSGQACYFGSLPCA